MLGLDKIFGKIFRGSKKQELKKWNHLVREINDLSEKFNSASDAELRSMTDVFRKRLGDGENLETLLCEAFALVREASFRVLGMRHFNVQLLGGIALHNGMVAEMRTGEGKTLVATLPAYLNALTGNSVHIVTVNDYLASRDEAWMRPLYEFLGMSTGVVSGEIDHESRKDAYLSDVTYVTNNELGFDFLRDNMKYSMSSSSQRGHNFAILDEVDSILIDEARTPLIISGNADNQTDLYEAITKVVSELKDDLVDVDEKSRSVNLNDAGVEEIEKMLSEKGFIDEGSSLYEPQNVTVLHHVTQSIRAYKIFVKDKDYIVRNNSIVIIDEFTGRMMPNRRFSDGLHQALEAKESVEIRPENVTVASVTFQNYFRMYEKLAGMTGTAMTEKEEFDAIYGLDVVDIPTNLPVKRKDDDDLIFSTMAEKYDAIVEAVKESKDKGQPVLIGTVSIEKSELLSEELTKREIDHKVLNALYHEQEAQIIAHAGAPGTVTVATNMAGRGTDIKLGGNVASAISDIEKTVTDKAERDKKVKEILDKHKEDEAKAIKAGGLRIIGTERHESRRIDNQLRGRAGRQGDPGQSTFFLSLEDDLMRIFGSERIKKLVSGVGGLPKGEPITHPWISRAVERAQVKIESRNFDIRKNLLKYDDVVNQQRMTIFEQRRDIVANKEVSEIIVSMRNHAISRIVDESSSGEKISDVNTTELAKEVERVLSIPAVEIENLGTCSESKDRLISGIQERSSALFAERTQGVDPRIIKQIEKILLIQELDALWSEHLVSLDHLKQIIGLRGYGNKDPLNEYKREAFFLFDMLLIKLRENISSKVMSIKLVGDDKEEGKVLALPTGFKKEAILFTSTDLKEEDRDFIFSALGIKAFEYGQDGTMKEIAHLTKNKKQSGSGRRNDPCSCGSGKKFKHCHGKV